MTASINHSNRKSHKIAALILPVFVIILAMLACSQQEQQEIDALTRILQETAQASGKEWLATSLPKEKILTEVAVLARTAVAEGGEMAATEAAKLKATLPGMSATEIAGIKATVEAGLATRISQTDKYQREFPSLAHLDALTVGAYYYPWYGPGRDHWQDGYKGQPTLGEYDSGSTEVVNRQIDWASGHGIDFFAISWWGPSSKENRVIQNAFFKSSLIREIRFALLYESTGRLHVSGGQIDLDDPNNQQILLDDLQYIQSTYFNHPQYLRIHGRPVVFFYLTRLYTGNVPQAIAAVRERLRQQGAEVYFIGDEVYWRKYHLIDSVRLGPWDAVTAYNMHESVPGVDDGFSSRVREEYTTWRDAAYSAGVAFIPGILPGFDDTAVRPQENHPVLPRSAAFFGEQIDLGLQLLDPQVNLLMINSWNEWHEATSIEPEMETGFQLLNVLKEKLRLK